MPQKKEEEELFSVCLRLDAKLVEKVEFDWRAKQYRNRTSYVSDALSSFIEGIRCPTCGAINPKAGRICSVCLRPLPKEKNLNVKITLEGTDSKVRETKKTDAKKGRK